MSSKNLLRIGIDLMGSDAPPHLLFEAVLEAAEQLGSSFFLLVIATDEVIKKASAQISARKFDATSKIHFHEVAEFISMSDDPSAVRFKKGSSIMVGMNLLQKNQLNAFISCGNTGALLTSAALTLPMLPNISRPALLATLPTKKGSIIALDVGGLISPKQNYLIEFAFLGAAYQQVVKKVENPLVGFLNVGVESKKGTLDIRQAYEYLESYIKERNAKGISPGMKFIGNIEARDVFNGGFDVLVTDGFAGNVLLKTAEGVASFIFEALEQPLKDCPETLSNSLNTLKNQFNYAEYPGAFVCGVDGLVIKVHGSGERRSLLSSIIGAAQMLQNDLIDKLKSCLEK